MTKYTTIRISLKTKKLLEELQKKLKKQYPHFKISMEATMAFLVYQRDGEE